MFHKMNQSSNCKSNICGNTLCDILKHSTLFFFFNLLPVGNCSRLPNGPRGDSKRCHCPVAKRHAARRLIKALLKPVKTQVKMSVSLRKAFSAILYFFLHWRKLWTQHCCCVYDNLFSSHSYFNFSLLCSPYPFKEQLGWLLATTHKE